MATLPTNPDLTPSNRRPGVYVYNLLAAAPTGTDEEPHHLLILGERIAATASKPPNTPFAITSEDDAADFFGAKSTVRRMARAALSQAGAGNIRITGLGVAEPSGGVAAIYKDVITGTATAPGTLRYQICGEEVSVGYAIGDANTDVVTDLLAELAKLSAVPCTFADAGAGVITRTYNIKGEIGEDCPVRVYNTEGTGIHIGPGDLTIAVAATGAGSLKLSSGTQTISATINNLDAVATIATAMQTAIGEGDYFVTAGTPAGGVLPLYYANGRDIRRISAYVLTTTGTTAQLTGGSATDGTGSANSKTYGGTVGTGTPTLTTALATIAAAGTYGEWVCPWTSATPLGTIATQIEAEANGEIQKNQHLTVCLVGTESAAAAIPSATTPALTGSLRYVLAHCQESGQQGYEVAARIAAQLAADATPATNHDGAPLRTTAAVPLNFPAVAVRASNATIKAAINDGLMPVVVKSGQLVIETGRNTSTADDQDLQDVSYIRQFGLYRRELRTDGAATFAQKNIKRDGQINSSNQVSLDAVTAFAVGKMFEWEDRGLYDGAEALKSGAKAELDEDVTGRVNLYVPASPVIPFHQLGVVAAQAKPQI